MEGTQEPARATLRGCTTGGLTTEEVRLEAPKQRWSVQDTLPQELVPVFDDVVADSQVHRPVVHRAHFVSRSCWNEGGTGQAVNDLSGGECEEITMPINPVQFAHSVCDEFLRYFFSAFPLSDPDLAKQARKLPQGPLVARHPAGQGTVRLPLRSVRQGRVRPDDGRPRACSTRSCRG